MIDKDVLYQYGGEYEGGRQDKKLGNFSLAFIIIKATIGLSAFGFHSIYERSGVGLGVAISIVYIYLGIYGIMRSVKFAEELEAESAAELRIENYHEMVDIMMSRDNRASWLGHFVLVISFSANFMVTMASYITLNKMLVDYIGVSGIWAILIMGSLFLVMSLLFVEPENIYLACIVSTFIFFVLIVLSTYYGLIDLFSVGFDAKGLKQWDTKELSQSIGYSINAIEIILYIFNIRRMQKPENQGSFKRLGTNVLLLCALLYIIPSLLVYVTKYKQGLNELYFNTYYDEHMPIRVTYYSFSFLLLYNLCSFNIFQVEMLEKVKYAQNMLRNEKKELSAPKIIIVRVVLYLMVAFISSFVHDFIAIYSICGIICATTIGLILPGYLGLMRDRVMILKQTRMEYYLDLICLISGVVCIVLYFGELLS